MQIVVPGAGNQNFPRSVNDLSVHRGIPARDCNRLDLLSLNDYGGIRPGWVVGSINDRYIHDGNLVLSEGGMESRRGNE